MASSFTTIRMPDSYANLMYLTQSHLGGKTVTNNMKKYIFGKRPDSINVFDTKLVWEKFILAARAFAGIEHSENILAISGKTFGRRSVLKFAESVKCQSLIKKFTPGLFTNKSIKRSMEPRLIIVSDPTLDEQAVNEAAKINCPIVGFCNTDAELSFVDIAIPVNNRSPHAIAAGFFILSRLINYILHGIDLETDMKEFELFVYRDPTEIESLCNAQKAEDKVEISPEVAATMANNEEEYAKNTVSDDEQEW